MSPNMVYCESIIVAKEGEPIVRVESPDHFEGIRVYVDKEGDVIDRKSMYKRMPDGSLIKKGTVLMKKAAYDKMMADYRADSDKLMEDYNSWLDSMKKAEYERRMAERSVVVKMVSFLVEKITSFFRSQPDSETDTSGSDSEYETDTSSSDSEAKPAVVSAVPFIDMNSGVHAAPIIPVAPAVVPVIPTVPTVSEIDTSSSGSHEAEPIRETDNSSPKDPHMDADQVMKDIINVMKGYKSKADIAEKSIAYVKRIMPSKYWVINRQGEEPTTALHDYIDEFRGMLPDDLSRDQSIALNLYISALATAQVSYAENETEPLLMERVFYATFDKFMKE